MFLCRRCHRLAYTRQSEDAITRAQRRAGNIRQRLGGSPDRGALFPPMPKGMWQRTYERMCRRHLKAEERADDAYTEWAAGLVARW